MHLCIIVIVGRYCKTSSFSGYFQGRSGGQSGYSRYRDIRLRLNVVYEYSHPALETMELRCMIKQRRERYTPSRKSQPTKISRVAPGNLQSRNSTRFSIETDLMLGLLLPTPNLIYHTIQRQRYPAAYSPQAYL